MKGGIVQFSRFFILLGASAACAGAAATTSDESDSQGSRKLTYSLQVVTKAAPTSDPTCPLEVLVEGAGLTNLLGPIHDWQRHCAHQDGTVDQGVFTFSAAALVGTLPGGQDSKDSISGKYRARLVPSVGSNTSGPPSGYWLTYGEVCIWKGTGRYADVIDDCPSVGKPGRFFPARLTLDLNTGQGNVFGVAVVRFNEDE
jgi:hypothetical protein